MRTESTAIIQEAYWDTNYNVVWGYIWGDSKGRFRDGTWIHTSVVTNAKPGDKPAVIETLNSTYEVQWADEAPAQDTTG